MYTNRFIAIPAEAAERHFTPAYDETHERLLRMGIIDAEGKVVNNIAAFCAPFAAALYDDLLESGEDMPGIYENIARLSCNEEITGLYLYLCLLYGQMGKVIPEPIQWLSGHDSALLLFCEAFADKFADYLNEDGFILDEDEDDNDGSIKIIITNKKPFDMI